MPRSTTLRGFTLIELLIVVAIIAILAAIAVPNFIEAQVRSKVAGVKADMRSVATAMESYMVDSNTYPPYRFIDQTAEGWYGAYGTTALTTPVAYITSIPVDPFKMVEGDYAFRRFEATTSSSKEEGGRGGPSTNWVPWPKDMFLMASAGPDRVEEITTQRFPARFDNERGVFVYDASNGSVSRGDIFRWVCPARYNPLFEVGYDPYNGINPFAPGAYP